MTKPKTNADKAETYAIHTSQEIDAINRARANGRTFAGYAMNEQSGTVRYEHAALAHSVELVLTEAERRGGLGMEYLETLVRAQDADALIAQLYIMSVLAPPPPSPPRELTQGWIDFDDVIEKIGWYPQTTQERRQMHARIWEFIEFGERAAIIGERTTPYVDPKTKKPIDTFIKTPIWHVTAIEHPAQGTLPFALETPVAAEIFISAPIVALITSPVTAQFLPMGEVLGALPGGKPAGAWARVLGLALASFWRRHPQKALSGEIKPTRRELLTHYPPKIAPADEVLQGHNSQRAIKYWCGALQTLVETGLLLQHGETLISEKQMRAALPPRGWQDQWFDERVDLQPGEEMRGHIVGRAKAIEGHTVPRRSIKK